MTTRYIPSPRSNVRLLPAAPVDRLARVNEVLELLVAALGDAHELSERERCVAHELLFGRNSYAIAGRLGIDERSVLHQIRDLFAKTDTGDREALMRLALRLAGERERADAPVRSMSPSAPAPAPTCPPARRGADGLESRSAAKRSRHAGVWPVASTHDR
jgi:DNA-binding CsgD family transcriptional regulator